MRSQIQTVISEGGYQTVSRQSLVDALERTGALALTQQRAIEYAEGARAALDGLNGSIHTQALRAIPTYCIDRDR